jgi:NAD(P)-dependent dehydrogenase (short-subunit alcohol dehydrogenase family)
MDEFKGRVAVVTGAAGGIGLALAKLLGREGAKVVLSDVQPAKLDAAVEAVRATGGPAIGVVTDVTNDASVEALAQATQDAFGAPHLLFANAGVATYGSVWDQSLDDWRWTLGVNLWGVVHCLRAFVPRMLAHGQAGHVVITSSSSGLAAGSSSAYTASKFAVVGLAEGLAKEFAETPLGVSVLCPGGVATDIVASEKLRPAEFAQRGVLRPEVAQRIAALGSPDRTDRASPEFIADTVLAAVRSGQFYVLPMQGRLKAQISERVQAVQAGLDASPTTAP